MKPFTKTVLTAMLTFIVSTSVLPAGEFDDVPLEEQIEALRGRLWDAMYSTDPSSVQEFIDLTKVIQEKELALSLRPDEPDPVITIKDTPTPSVVKASPQVVTAPNDVPVKQIAYPQLFHKHVVVDKSNYTLTVYNDDKVIAGQRVIIGRRGRETPSFNSEITHVVFNPYWNVSQRIATIDLAPEFLLDPKSIIERGFQVFDSWKDDAKELDPLMIDWTQYDANHQVPYLVRQKPGPENVVGQVKFMVKSVGPQTNGIILHGSPRSEHNLFDTDTRQYSSGCVRVEDEIQLARLVLNHGGGYTDEQIQSIIDSGRTRWVKVKTPVKVTIQ